MATVDEHGAAGHEAARVTQSEESSTSEFLRVGKTPEHVLGFPDSSGCRILLEHLFHHWGDDMAGAQAVHADTVTAPFHSEGSGQLDHSRLGGIVDGRGHSLVGNQTAHAGNEKDGTLLLVVEHLPRSSSGRVEDSIKVNLHDFVKSHLRVFQSALQVVDSCGGNQAIQSPVLACDFRKEVVYFRLIPDINTVVLQAATIVLLGMLLSGEEVGVGGLESIQAVDCIRSFRLEVAPRDKFGFVDPWNRTFRTSLHQSFSHRQSESSSTTSDGEDTIVEVKLAEPMALLGLAFQRRYPGLDVV